MPKKTNKRTPIKRIVRYKKPSEPRSIAPVPEKRGSVIGTASADTTFFQSLRIRLSGQSEITDPYQKHSYVYACINAIAQNIASVPFKLFRGPTDKKKPVEEGEIYNLFRDVNPHMSRYQLWEATMIYLGLEGECMWLLERPKGKEDDFTAMPTEIWAVSGKNFEPIVMNNVFVGWKHQVGAKTETLTMAQVIQFKYFNPYNYYRGLSPLQAAKMAIDQDWNAMRYNLAFFENSADPGGVLIYKGGPGREPLTKQQRTAIREAWESRHKGAGKARRVAILEDLDYKETGLSHHDMQFLEQRKWNREELMAVFKVPKSELSLYEDVNFATAQSQDRNFWIKTLIPKMNYIADVLESKLFKYIDKGETWGYFDTTVIEALQEELNKKIDAGYKLWQMGYPINKVNTRLDLGLEEIAWGNMIFMPMSMVPVTSILSGDTPATPATPNEEAVKPTDTKALPKPEPEIKLTKIDLDKYWLNYVAKILDPNEKKFFSKIKRYIFELRSEQLRLLEEAGKSIQKLDSWDIESVLFSKEDWDRKLKGMTRPLYENIMEMAGKEFADELGGLFQFDLTDPAMLQFLNTKLIRVTKINATLQQALRETLMEGIALRETIGELQGRFKTVFNFASNRSLTIARTETAQTSSGTRWQAMKQEGIKKHKWVTAGDEHVRISHSAQQGKEVNIGMKFPNGLRYPSDIEGPGSEVINCRCVAVPVTTKE